MILDRWLCSSARINHSALLSVPILKLTPLFSTLISTLYLGAAAGIRLWIGCVLVIAGAITCRLAVRET